MLDGYEGWRHASKDWEKVVDIEGFSASESYVVYATIQSLAASQAHHILSTLIVTLPGHRDAKLKFIGEAYTVLCDMRVGEWSKSRNGSIEMRRNPGEC